MAESRNVLIIYAHPEPASFNGALKDRAVATLRKLGHNVRVSDLYGMRFKATTTKEDIVAGTTNRPFNYADETAAAYQDGRLAQDIVEEIEKLEWADMLILQFPIQWFGVPAILKGWIDRVLVKGKTFSAPKLYDTGVFKGRRAMLSCTTGSPASAYQPNGINGDMNIILWPMENGWLNFLGYSVLKSNVCHGVSHASDDERRKMLEDWECRLSKVFNEKPLEYLKREDFEHHGFGALKPDSFKHADKAGKVPLGQRDTVRLPGYESRNAPSK